MIYGIFEVQSDFGIDVWFSISGAIIRAAACDFQQFDILTSVDSDEPVQPPVKLSNSKWCSVRS